MASQADAARRKDKSSALRAQTFLLKGKTLFAFCILVGSISIFSSDPVGLPLFLGVVVPLVMMAIYLALGLNGFADAIDTETFADSVYYMGFLLTLISLSAALFYLRNEDPSLNLLVAKFGLALVTTIVGLATRVTLVNFKLAGNQARQHAEEKLSAAAERFSNDLELTCDKMSVLLGGIIEKVEMTANGVTTASNEATEAISQTSKDNQEALRAMYQSVGTKWGESVDQLMTEVRDRLSNAVAEAGNGIEGIGEQISNEIAKFKVDEDAFSRPLKLPLDNLAQTIQTANVALAKEFGNLHEASKNHEKIREQFNRLGAALDSGEQTIASLNKYSSDLSEAFSDLNAVDSGLSALGIQSAAVSDSFRQLSQTVATSSTSFSADVQTSKHSFLKLNQSLNALLHAVTKQSEEMGLLVQKIAADAEVGRSSLRQVQDNLVESAGAIVRHLK